VNNSVNISAAAWRNALNQRIEDGHQTFPGVGLTIIESMFGC